MEPLLQLSVLDQSPVREGGTATEALQETIALAVATEAMGYRRFWVAEHHNMPGIASAATSIVIAHVAAGTNSLSLIHI